MNDRRRPTIAGWCLIAGAIACPAASQRFTRLEPVVPSAGRVSFARSGAGADAKITLVRWTVGNGTLEIPLQSPVSHCDAAIVGEDGLVILAGGNSEDLQVYTVGAEGSIHRVPTDGGRRLPATFADGLGSWPVADGRQLLMFAYQKGNTVQFRALDFAGRILASRSLPEQATGFEAQLVESSHRVQVKFSPGSDLVFAHPDAPRVQAQAGLVEFGEVRPGRPARRRVILRNDGRSTAIVRGATNEPAFSLVGRDNWEIPPGGEVGVDLDFDPTAAGTIQARLELSTNSPDDTLLVVLRGTRADDPEPAEPVVDPEPLAALAPPAVPAFDHVAVRVASAEVAEIVGVLAAAEDPERREPAAVLVVLDPLDNELARVDLAGANSFLVRVPASPGSRLVAKVIGASGAESGAAELVRVGPELRIVDGVAVVIGRPRAAYRISALLEVGSHRVAVGGWVGELDADGGGELPLAALGAPPTGVWLEAQVRARSGRWVRAIPVRVP